NRHSTGGVSACAHAPRTVSEVDHAPHTVLPSESYLQSELNIPRAESLRRPSEIRIVCVAHGPSQIHPGEVVEEFRPEFELCAVCPNEPWHHGLLRDNEVCVGLSGTQEGVAPQVSENAERRFGKITYLEDSIGEHVVRP